MRHDRIVELIRYDAASGVVSWNVARGCRAAGAIAGFRLDHGYLGIRIDGLQLLLHRAIFFWVTGRLPEFVDHINGDRSDNRWANLREVTRSENGMNMALPSGNTSGVIGVFWNLGKGKWTAKIKVRQKETHLGHFETKDEAIAVRKNAERELGFHANHGRRSLRGAP